MNLVAIGASWGGLYALMELLGALPNDFNCPIVIAQHRAPTDDEQRLGAVLGRYSALPIADAHDKTPLEPARAYLAPADYHLLVERGHLALSTDAPVEWSRPSVDVLFESAADSYGSGVVAVLLTGLGRDGAAGLARVRDAGGTTIVQEPATADRSAMPQAAIDAGGAVEILPLEAIAPRIVQLCGVMA